MSLTYELKHYIKHDGSNRDYYMVKHYIVFESGKRYNYATYFLTKRQYELLGGK